MALPICSALNPTPHRMESGCPWGAEGAGTRQLLFPAARAAQVQYRQAATGTSQQMERRQDSGLSTTGSVRRTDRVGSTEALTTSPGTDPARLPADIWGSRASVTLPILPLFHVSPPALPEQGDVARFPHMSLLLRGHSGRFTGP